MAQHNTSQGFLTSISETYISTSIPLQKELPNILMYDPLAAHVERSHGEHIFGAVVVFLSDILYKAKLRTKKHCRHDSAFPLFT